MANHQPLIQCGQPDLGLNLFASYWGILEMQLHDFNEYKVVAMSGSFYESLGHAGRRFMQECMKNHVLCEYAFFVRDGMHHDRWFLGPYEDLQHIPGSAIYPINGVPTLVVGGDEPPFPPDQNAVTQMASDNDIGLINSFDAVQIPAPVDVQPIIAPQVADVAPVLNVDATQQNSNVQVNAVKIPRPPNAYILYRRDKQEGVKRDNPGIKNNEISVITGDMWNNESRNVRSHYANLADELKAAFYAKHPDYKYNPRRPEEVKRRAKRSTSNPQKISKKIKGKLGKQRKVLVGELDESHFQAFQNETETGIGPYATEQRFDDPAERRPATVSVTVADQVSLDMQLDINEWNTSISDSQSDDIENIFDNGDPNTFPSPTNLEFANTNEMDSTGDDIMNDLEF